ncbi:MAG: hypothetical protein JSR80_01740 [Verrucomicrobia bacterium]|nr:hypothetical protein [Verrucomicrobiota bacterium]
MGIAGNLIYELQVGRYAEKINATFREVALLLANMGHPLIIDDVAYSKQYIEEWKETLKNFQVLWVGVSAPLAILEQRERERGNRILGSARGQFHKVHVDIAYDLRIETHVSSPREAAEKIMAFASLT